MRINKGVLKSNKTTKKKPKKKREPMPFYILFGFLVAIPLAIAYAVFLEIGLYAMINSWIINGWIIANMFLLALVGWLPVFIGWDIWRNARSEHLRNKGYGS